MMTSDCQCSCHNGPHYTCDVPGGCGSTGCGRNETRRGTCFAGEHCRARDPITKKAAATADPLCGACLEGAERDTRALVYDYLDLAQLHEASMSQAINEKTDGSKDSPLLIAGHVEALQAELVHVLTTWEYEVRVTARLSDPRARVPIADWHTTLTRPAPEPKVRAGHAVQRAVAILAPRMRMLSLIGPTAVCPTGVEDDPADVAGWEAIHHLTALHKRARSYLGRTRRTLALHGTCANDDCTTHALYRNEPAFAEDEPPVWCDACKTTRPYRDYEHFMVNLAWPKQPADTREQVAA